MASFGRLLHLGNVVVDVVLDVPALPDRGGDVLASGSRVSAGGSFNVMVAAARQGLPVACAGAYGSGPFAALARDALTGAGIEVLQRPKAGIDTGFVVAVVDADGERTFLTSRGAEATLTTEDPNGAGDTHTGVFIAALARGESEPAAARAANAAAALAVTRRGPATAPGAGAGAAAFLAEGTQAEGTQAEGTQAEGTSPLLGEAGGGGSAR
jgi:sugar/nucleoside kinase (ribokinase family)